MGGSLVFLGGDQTALEISLRLVPWLFHCARWAVAGALHPSLKGWVLTEAKGHQCEAGDKNQWCKY